MRVLAIGAHYDDIEIGCGGTIARHVSNGDEVVFLSVSHSGYKSVDGIELRDAETAKAESERAASILNVKDLRCLNLTTLDIKYDLFLINSILSVIESVEADTIYTHWINDIHQDHSNVSKATLAATKYIPRVLMYRSNIFPSTNKFRGSIYQDISNFFEIKQNALDGQIIGVQYAEVFEPIKYLVP